MKTVWKTNKAMMRSRSYYYLSRLWSLNSFEDFVKYKLFPNPKEVTESFAMLNAVEAYTDLDKEDNTITVFVVGDGKTPRTAALFAFMTKWTCISIDPMLTGDYSGIQRLITYKAKIECVKRITNSHGTRVIILPHSHARIDVAYGILKNERTWIVTMPCCISHTLDLPGMVYRDIHVASPKNEIKIYCNYKKPVFEYNV